jgi:hypothetical protein
MMLALSLVCVVCVSCKTPARILPAVHQGPQGNAVLMTLPAGTAIEMSRDSSDESRALLQSAFANELTPGPRPSAFVLRRSLIICTPAYLAERDAAEMNLHRRIAALEAKSK